MINNNHINPLPKRWYIIVDDENKQTLNKWFKIKHPSSTHLLVNGEIVDVEARYGEAGTHIDHDEVQIAFDTFKKYVFNDELIEPIEDMSYLIPILNKLNNE